jgi:hypothetical protein
MQVLLYTISGFSILMGLFILVKASKYQFKQLGLTLGGLTYLIGGILSIKMLIWWPVLGTWILSFGIRKIFGDSIE